MLSRLQAAPHLFRNFYTRLYNDGNQKLQQNIINKRWSGHNTMDITPSNADWKYVKNWLHFYVLLGLIPVSIVTTIISIRANPELSEVPDGYEPRHWEYFRHPISRWMAKYMYVPPEREEECNMALLEYNAEIQIVDKIAKRVDKVMRFYNDHRTKYFLPFYGEYYRSGRDHAMFMHNFEGTSPNVYYDLAHDPDVGAVPITGYPDGPVSDD